jgi:hypothetical protein
MKSNKYFFLSALSSAIFIAVLFLQFVFSSNGTNNTNSVGGTSKFFFSEPYSHTSNPVSENAILLTFDEQSKDETFNEKSTLPVLLFSVLTNISRTRDVDNGYISQFLIITVTSIPLHIKNCIYLI